MSFSLLGSIITQTGTDTSLAGLASISGVTVKSLGGLKIYDIGSNQLHVTGNLSIDGISDCLESSASSDALSVHNNGTLNLGIQKTGSNNYTYFEPTLVFISTANPANWFYPGVKSFSNGALACVIGGTINWNRAIIYFKNGTTSNGFSFEDGTVTINDGVVISGQGSAPSGREIISGIHSPNVTINGFTMIGGELIIGPDSVGSTISGLLRENSAIAIFPNRLSNITFENADVGGRGNVVDVSVQTEGVSNTHTKMLNCVTGNNLNIVGAENRFDNRNNGTVRIQKQLSITAFNSSGQGIGDAKLYIKDTNNGQRKNLNGLNDTSDKIYQATSLANGTFSTQTIDTAIVNVDGTNNRGTSNTGAYRMDFRGKNDSTLQAPNIPANTAEFDFAIASYLHNITTLPVLLLGADVLYQNVTMIDDLNISASKSVVDAYSTINNSAQLYDRAKAYLCDNFQGESETIVNRSGNLIDAGSYNVTIDATATAAFDITGNLITIKASTFTGDMVTTGLITLANGAVFNGVRTDANGTVYPDQPIRITNILAGSRMRIYNVTTGVETVNTVVSGTSYTSSYQEGTDYTDGDTIRVYLTKLGKSEWVADVIDTSNGFNVLASQVDDDIYSAMGVDGSTVTKFQANYPNNEVDLAIGSDWTMAEFYAWWAYNLTTEDGIRNFFGGISAIDQANFRINTSIVDLYLDNTTNASYKQTDNRRFFRDTGDGYPVRNPTTSGYGLDVVWRNTILSLNLSQIESIQQTTDSIQKNTKLIPGLL